MADSARSAALALVSRRDFTAAELASRLEDKGYDADAIAPVVAELRDKRFIDDRRVAAAHVRTASSVKGRGRIRIGREMAARGIAPEIIEDALRAVAPDDEAALIRKILTRRRWSTKSSMADRQKLYRHLLARGFPADAIGRALGRRHDED